MNAGRMLQCVLLCLFGAGCFLLFAGAAPAAEGCSNCLQGNIMYELVADRSRMIQVSLVFVAIGCAVIWWYR